MRILVTILGLLLLAAGCTPDEGLHLVLAEVEPDPLEGAASLRVSFDPGTGEREVVTLDLEGNAADGGLSGDSIADLEIEVLDASGQVLALGHRTGDLTPTEGEVREETVLVLRTGVFSTVPGLEMDRERADACAVVTGDDRVLVAGGGDPSVELLDLETGSVTWGSAELSGNHVGCHAATLADGSTGVASPDDEMVDLVGVAGGLDRAYHSGRIGGALTSVGNGEALWWMGGEELNEDLSSDLYAEGQWVGGPLIEDQAREGHAVVCPRGGERCAVVGSTDRPTGWLHVEANEVLQGGGAAISGFGVHDLMEDEPPGWATHAVALGLYHVVALTEDLDGSYLSVFDLSEDGALDLLETLPGGLAGAALASLDSAWVIGGDGTQGTTDVVRQVSDTHDGWAITELQATLMQARHGATAVATPDGRLIVIGGRDADGQRIAGIEIFQP